MSIRTAILDLLAPVMKCVRCGDMMTLFRENDHPVHHCIGCGATVWDLEE